MVGVLQGSVGQVNDLKLGGLVLFSTFWIIKTTTSMNFEQLMVIFILWEAKSIYPVDLRISVYPTHSPSGTDCKEN